MSLQVCGAANGSLPCGGACSCSTCVVALQRACSRTTFLCVPCLHSRHGSPPTARVPLVSHDEKSRAHATHGASTATASRLSRAQRGRVEEDLLGDAQLAGGREEGIAEGGAGQPVLALRLEEAEDAAVEQQPRRRPEAARLQWRGSSARVSEQRAAFAARLRGAGCDVSCHCTRRHDRSSQAGIARQRL